MSVHPLETRPKSVALVALGPSYRDFVNARIAKKNSQRFDEIWVVNSGLEVFKADKIFTIEALREDYDAYARKAGQAEPFTDEELRSAFYAWASPTNRAAHSRRGFFLHFPR